MRCSRYHASLLWSRQREIVLHTRFWLVVLAAHRTVKRVGRQTFIAILLLLSCFHLSTPPSPPSVALHLFSFSCVQGTPHPSVKSRCLSTIVKGHVPWRTLHPYRRPPQRADTCTNTYAHTHISYVCLCCPHFCSCLPLSQLCHSVFFFASRESNRHDSLSSATSRGTNPLSAFVSFLSFSCVFDHPLSLLPSYPPSVTVISIERVDALGAHCLFCLVSLLVAPSPMRPNEKEEKAVRIPPFFRCPPNRPTGPLRNALAHECFFSLCGPLSVSLSV